MLRLHIHHWPLWLLLLLGSCHPARGQCVSHDCSDDTRGVLGNETLVWGAVDATPPVDRYEIKRDDQAAPCLTVGGTTTTANIATPCLGEPRPPGGADIVLRVRACNSYGCSSGWPNGTSFRPHVCLRSINEHTCTTRSGGAYDCHDGCESPCWTGAPDRLPFGPCP